MISEDNKEGTLSFKDVISSRNKESDILLSKNEKLIECDDPVNIQFTSGTTSLPKGTTLTHHNIINNGLFIAQRLQLDLERPILCFHMPLFHALGCVIGTFTTFSRGGTIVFPSASFDSVASLKAIEKYKCNVLFGTPTMIIDVIKNNKQVRADISSIKQVGLGGSNTPSGLIKEVFNELKVLKCRNIYGLTETGPVLATTTNEADLETTISNYLEPLEEIEIKIVDNDNRIVPKGTKGEICSRGYSTFSGYWKDQAKTDAMVDQRNWVHSGDVGVMNEKGWVKIVGRIKDIVIRGGENIYSAEVESFLSTHPAILEVHICGVPDPRLGEELCCWIVVQPKMTLTEEEVRNFCQGKISNYKIPRYITFVNEFPKTTSGKIKKNEMSRISKEKLNLKELL